MTSVEAQTTITLFLRREGRYKEAIEVVKKLKAEYPRDYLFWLEEANLRKDAGEGMGAVDAYREIHRSECEARVFLVCADGVDVLRSGRRAAGAAAL